MRFWRKKANRVLVVGIFQNVGAGRAVLQNLHSARFRRTAVIYASAKGRQRVEEHGISAIAGSAVASLALGAFVVWERGMLAHYAPTGLLLLLAAFTLAGAIIGWTLVQLLRQHVDATSLARFTGTILPNETMVVAEVDAGEASRALVVGRGAKPRGPSFLRRLREIEHALEWANASLTMSAEAHHAFTLSAEWLLDNAYLIREQVADLRKSLPQKYYGKLPLIASGPNAGLPRVYQVAAEMVAETDGALEPDIIRRFLAAFQAITPLDIGELWALPLMLRLQLLECLRTLAIQVDQQQRESEEADFWANRL